MPDYLISIRERELVGSSGQLNHIRGAIRSTYDSHTYDETFRTLCNSPLLVLEDVGHENRTPWSQEKLYQLLSHRSLYQLALVMTTAYDVARLDGRIAGQILNNPDCEICPL